MTLGSHRRLAAHITGRVQGVGFRYFTRQTARHLGLTGWVRNEPAGSVSVLAEGPVDDLEALLDALRQGPAGAAVRAVDDQWAPATGAFRDFSILG